MNYWFEVCKYNVTRWYERVTNGCSECAKVSIEFSDYIIDNHVVF
jgi:hypothetical protein